MLETYSEGLEGLEVAKQLEDAQNQHQNQLRSHVVAIKHYIIGDRPSIPVIQFINE